MKINHGFRGVAFAILFSAMLAQESARAGDENLPVEVRDALQEAEDAYKLGRSALETAEEQKGADRENSLARARRAFEKALGATSILLRALPKAGLSSTETAKAIGMAEYNSACYLSLLDRPQEGLAALLRAIAAGWWDRILLDGDMDLLMINAATDDFEKVVEAAREKYVATWKRLHPAVVLWGKVVEFEESQSEEWTVLGAILGQFDALEGAPADDREQEARVAGATMKALLAARGQGMPIDATKARALLAAALARGGASRRAANAATALRILGVEDVAAVDLALTVRGEFPEALPADERAGFDVLARARGRKAPELAADKWFGAETPIRLAALNGKTVVFTVDSGSSARSSLASVRSLRHLAEIRRRYADKGVAVFALVFNAPKDDVGAFLSEIGVQVPAGVPATADWNWAPTGEYPAFWVIRKDGIVHGHLLGFSGGWLSRREQLLESALESQR